MKKTRFTRPSKFTVMMCLLTATGLGALSSSVYELKPSDSTSVVEANSAASATLKSSLRNGKDTLSDWDGAVLTFRSELSQEPPNKKHSLSNSKQQSSTTILNYSHDATAKASWSDFESSVTSFTATAPATARARISSPCLSMKKSKDKIFSRKQADHSKLIRQANMAISSGTASSARASKSEEKKSDENQSGLLTESTRTQLQLVASSIESAIQTAPTIAAVHLLRLAAPNLEGMVEPITVETKAAVEPVNETILSCPVTNSIVTSDYGMRTHPITGQRHLHNGVDFSAENNQPVHALLDGIVTKCGKRGALGIAVEIYHPCVDKSTIVGHLNGVAVKKGEVIKQNQVIGYAGSTGRSTGVHVHFMVGGAEGYEDPNEFLVWLNDNRTALAKGEAVDLPVTVRKGKQKSAVVATKSSKQSSATKKGKATIAKAVTKKSVPMVTEAQVEAATDLLLEKQRLAEMFEYLYKEGAVSRNQVQEKLAEAKAAHEKLQTLKANRKG